MRGFAAESEERDAVSVRTPGQLWRRAAAADSTRPFLTSYDATTGARVEMSFATFDNWVAKTANMLVDGLGVLPGGRVALALPLHWQSLAWVVACWSAGVAVVLADGDRVPEADVAVADRDRLDAAFDSGAHEVVAASLHPLGLPLGDCPPAATDYTEEVRGYGDRFAAAPVDPGAVALVNGDIVRTGGELVANGDETARVGRLTADDRVAIITSDPAPLAAFGDDLSRFLGVLSAGSAVVLFPGPDSTTLQSRLDTEHVTAVVGVLPDRLLPQIAARSLP